MKKMKTILGVMLPAAVCVLALAGCTREGMEKETGEVKFGFTSVAATTRTEFENHAGSPEGVTPSGTTKEQVNWVVGDVVTICSDRAVKLDGTTHVSEYEVSSLEGRASNPDGVLASVDNHGTGGGLRWADETNVHKFFAVYGTPASISMDGGVTGATIPANQTLTWNDDNTVGKTPMTYAYMVGLLETKYATPSVTLPLRQMYTAFQFTVSSGDNAEVSLSKFILSSTSTALAGGFTVAYPGGENPGISDLTVVPTATAPTASTPSTVTVNFPSGFKVVSGIPVTFTVLALGQSLTNMSITFEGTEIGTRTLALNKNSGQPIVFSPSTKNLINGLSFPNLLEATGQDIIWEQTAIGEDIAWLDDNYILDRINPYDLTYLGGTSETGAVISYKKKNNGDLEAVPWTVLAYYPTEADAQNGTNAYENLGATGWVSSYPASGVGAASKAGQPVSIVYAHSAVKTTEKTITPAEINAEIASSTFGLGSSADCYFNLANPTNKLSDVIVESANSYVVNGPGYYRIPMVMGNGVKANALNPDSYTKTESGNYSTNGHQQRNFRNHMEEVVSSPLLQKSNGSYTLNSAFVVWESAAGLIETTGTSYLLAPVGETNSPFTLSNHSLANGDDVYWLNFHVAAGEQGNAVIAVSDGTNVLWSYHIWVTNYICRNEAGSQDIEVLLNPDRSTFKYYEGKTDKKYKLMPINLGWLYSGENIKAIEYASNKMYVKIQQEGSNKITIMEVIRPGHHVVTQYGEGNSPYYQWGRKDPFQPTNETAGGGKYPTFLASQDPGTNISFGSGIQHPELFYARTSSLNPWTTVDLPAANAWSAKTKYLSDYMSNYNTGTSTTAALDDFRRNHVVVKTIYDPCPAGYSVSTFGAYSFRTDDRIAGNTPTYTISTGSWSGVDEMYNSSSTNNPYHVRNIDDMANIMGIKEGITHGYFHGFGFYTNTKWDLSRVDVTPYPIQVSEPIIFYPAQGYRSYYSGTAIDLTDREHPSWNGARGCYWSALGYDTSQGFAFDFANYWDTGTSTSNHYFNVNNWNHFPLADGCLIRPMQNDN